VRENHGKKKPPILKGRGESEKLRKKESGYKKSPRGRRGKKKKKKKRKTLSLLAFKGEKERKDKSRVRGGRRTQSDLRKKPFPERGKRGKGKVVGRL